MASDPFTEILDLTNAETVLAGGFSAGGNWAVRFPIRDRIQLSAVVKGTCWFWLEGEGPGEGEVVRLEAGDIGLLAARRPCVMASGFGIEPIEATRVFTDAGRTPAMIGNGADFGFIGGHVALDPATAPLLADVLPPWLLIKAGSPEAEAIQWLLNQVVQERASDFPGAQLALAHLAQLLFTQVVRAHLRDAGGMPAGWLRALADKRTAPALRLMHSDPGRDWGLEELASACAMSRTTFAGHFKATSGKAPLTYLTEWRMRLAERALRAETTSIAVIGQSVGYSSESAFSNAFKRVVGESPRAYRRKGVCARMAP